MGWGLFEGFKVLFLDGSLFYFFFFVGVGRRGVVAGSRVFVVVVCGL